MAEDSFKTIKEPSTGFFKDRQSKFYAYAYPVETEEEIKNIQKELRKKHYDARHHVYAFILGENYDNFRYSDDGEPSNSSGPPVLNAIKSHELTNILIVVVRYFGGKKLGVPGLINAYKTAAEDSIINAQIIEKTSDINFTLKFPYSLLNKVMYLCNKLEANIKKQDFTTDCKILVSIRKGKKEEFEQIMTQNGISIEND